MAQEIARREFLKFLAASPYVASLGGVGAFLQNGSDVIERPADAPRQSASAVLSSGASAHSGKPASSACSKSSRASCGS